MDISVAMSDHSIPDHLSETGEAVSITAPIKVAPIKSIFRIVAFSTCGFACASIRSFADAV
jgi:hypothetical protein